MWQEQLASCDIAEHFEIKFLASVLLRCAPELDFSGVAGKEGAAVHLEGGGKFPTLDMPEKTVAIVPQRDGERQFRSSRGECMRAQDTVDPVEGLPQRSSSFRRLLVGPEKVDQVIAGGGPARDGAHIGEERQRFTGSEQLGALLIQQGDTAERHKPRPGGGGRCDATGRGGRGGV